MEQYKLWSLQALTEVGYVYRDKTVISQNFQDLFLVLP